MRLFNSSRHKLSKSRNIKIMMSLIIKKSFAIYRSKLNKKMYMKKKNRLKMSKKMVQNR